MSIAAMRIERGVICQAMKHASTSSFFLWHHPCWYWPSMMPAL